MRSIFVGGHTRNIGKTALVVDIIRTFPEHAWTAVKLTQHGHGLCSVNGKECDCAPVDHSFAFDEELERTSGTDTSRFLEAGAVRAIWARSRQGCLGDFVPRLLREISSASHVIVETNSLLEFFQPDLYLVVLDPAKADFKDSARRFLARADAFVLRGPLDAAPWLCANGGPPLVSLRESQGKPQFVQAPGSRLPAAMVELLRHRFADSAHLSLQRSTNS